MCPTGLSYICCEVPTTVDSPEWHNPEKFIKRVWRELQGYEVVQEGQLIDTLTVKAPTSYKMPKVGYSEVVKKIAESLKAEHSILGADQWDFSKNDIIQSLQKILDNEVLYEDYSQATGHVFKAMDFL